MPLDLAGMESHSSRCSVPDPELEDELEQGKGQEEEQHPWGDHSKLYLAEPHLKFQRKLTFGWLHLDMLQCDSAMLLVSFTCASHYLTV